jgi:eukaryotic-like serine/threonine-protein kinase
MKPERNDYQAALESLADGTNVDWAALESSAATTAERRRYRNLRLVARVAELHRTLPLEGDGPSRWSAREDVAIGAPATWGHLEIRNRLASGAYGEIYVAHDPRLNVDVALKLLRLPATGAPVDHLLSEARTLAKVRHPNVVTIHGADVRDGRAGLWMDLVHGQTLETWLQAHGTMGATEASAIGVEVCRALAAVHAAGLVHGDVKAQNVMREAAGRTVLTDFGAGRTQGAEPVGVAGTPMYLAPEVLAGEPPTARSDIYSVGVLLFHLLAGSYPFAAASLEELRARHADGERRRLRDLRPDLPDSLIGAVERALDADPARRFATAGEMEQALVAQPRQIDVSAPTRAPVLAFAAAAAVLLAVVAALVIWSRMPGSRRGVVLAEVRTIGVLPMKDLTDSAVPEHFAEGLTDELIATLGEVKGLTVKPAAFTGKDGQSLQNLARALEVDALLETTLLRGEATNVAPRLRVRAKLIAAGSQTMVWTQVFERSRGATLELPRVLAGAIAEAVHAAVPVAESTRFAAANQTSPATEEKYLEGVALLNEYGSNSARLALEAFQRALQSDPRHAGAHSGAARAYVVLGLSGAIPNTQARAEASKELRRAIDVDPDLAEAHTTLGYLNFVYDWDWTAAEREFVHALELNENSAYGRTYYAEFLAARRRFEEAVKTAQTAKTLDPQSGHAARSCALVLYYAHDFSEAERALDDARAIEPNSAALPVLESRFAEVRGRFDDALKAITNALDRSGGENVGLRVQHVRQLAISGRRAEALAGLAELRRDGSAAHLSPRDLAYIQLALGNQDAAIELFSQAVALQEPTVVWLAVDPRLDVLQHNPGFRKVLLSIGLPLLP